MARLNIDTGTEGNTATGDTLRTAFTKANTNFIDLYNTTIADNIATATDSINLSHISGGVLNATGVPLNNMTLN